MAPRPRPCRVGNGCGRVNPCLRHGQPGQTGTARAMRRAAEFADRIDVATVQVAPVRLLAAFMHQRFSEASTRFGASPSALPLGRTETADGHPLRHPRGGATHDRTGGAVEGPAPAAWVPRRSRVQQPGERSSTRSAGVALRRAPRRAESRRRPPGLRGPCTAAAADPRSPCPPVGPGQAYIALGSPPSADSGRLGQVAGRARSAETN